MQVALGLLQKIGANPFDENRIMQTMEDMFRHNVEGLARINMEPRDVLANYINAHSHLLIKTKNLIPTEESTRILAGDTRYNVVGRYITEHDAHPGTLWLLVAPMRHWCQQQRVTFSDLVRDLKDQGIVTSVDPRMDLGWKLPMLNMAKASGLTIDMAKL